MNRPLSPSLRRQYEEYSKEDGGCEGDFDVTDTWKFRPGTSPAACSTSLGSDSLRRPWTVSLSSVKSFTSGASRSLHSLHSLRSLNFDEETRDPRLERRAHILAMKASNTCQEYRLSKREDDLRAFQGLWSAMSFRRPRGMDVLNERARDARRLRPPRAEGFVETGPTQQTPFDVAQACPTLQSLEQENVTLIRRIVEADALHFASCAAGQVLYREKDFVENGYILLSGSVQQYSNDHEYLRSQGWHPHTEHTDSNEAARHAQRFHHDYESPRDEKVRELPTLTEHVRKGGTLDRKQRFRSLEGYSAFSQDTYHGELYSTTTSSGAMIGEPALRGEKLWRHTAVCLKDCEFLVIDGTIFNHVLRTLRETMRFFELYLPGLRIIPKKDRKRPYPIEYWKEEQLAEGEAILEEGIDPLEPLVFMVLKGKVELRRYRMPGSNPAYVLATQPLKGKRPQVASKDVGSQLPEVARSFQVELDEDGLPWLGLPPALKGSVRHKLESEYWRDPANFVPDIKKGLSKEEARVYQHKVLLKERVESTANRRRERALQREGEAKEAKPLHEEEIDTRSPEQIADLKALMEYVKSMNVARPGSPEYKEYPWSERLWSTDTLTGPISRPLSSQMIREPEVRSDAEQETVGMLKPGDLFCSMSFFPIWGVPEPFSVVSGSDDCRVVVVRGVQEVKTIPKHILKETRVEIGRFLQKKLDALVNSSASKDSGPTAPPQKVPTLPSEDEAELEIHREHLDVEQVKQVEQEVKVEVKSVKSEKSVKSVEQSKSLGLERFESERSGRSGRSFRSGSGRSEPSHRVKSSDTEQSSGSFNSFARPKKHRVKRAPKPSMLRWLVQGKDPKESRCCRWWK